MVRLIDRDELIRRLGRIKYDRENGGVIDSFDKLKLSGVLVSVAQLDPEHEYSLCRTVAEHLLGAVPEPEEVESDD